MGLEALFSGIAQGVGETKLAIEKEKRDRQERDKQQRLNILTSLLNTPGLRPEQKSGLFRNILETASDNDKKVVEGIHSVLGPLLEQDGGQTGGVRTPSQGEEGKGGGAMPQGPAPASPAAPAAPAQAGGSSSPLPSSSLPKLGSSGSGGQPSLFYTPEEETQQVASRAGAVARATGEVDVEMYQKKLAAESDQKKKEGYHLIGFSKPDPGTGLVTPIYNNELTKQVAYGDAIDPFTSLQAMQEVEIDKAKIALAREEGVKNILQGKGIDPATATPAQRKEAEQGYANLITSSQEADIAAKKSGAFRDIATGVASLDKSGERAALTMQQQAMEYNRQRDDYAAASQKIGALVEEVENLKGAASNYFNQAMTIKNQLEQQKVDPEGSTNPDDPNMISAGITPARYQFLLGQARAALSQARNMAQSAAQAYKGQIEAGGLEDKPGVWPYIKDVRPPFTFDPSTMGLPPMPTQGGQRPASKSSQIDVPDSLLRDLKLKP